MGGGKVDREKKTIRGLAFFPVVAISSNLSTSLYEHKASKKNNKNKIIIRW
jgi:hypothetical protein